MARPPVRTDEGLMGSILRRLTLVERRVSKTPGGLPARLGPEGQEVTDWNLALAPGFYWSVAGATNAPPSTTVLSGVVGVSMSSGTAVVFQDVRAGADPYQATSYRRYRSSTGTWTPWRLNGRGRGPSTLRTAIQPQYLDEWYDTTTLANYLGSKSNTWRQSEGTVNASARAWDTTQTSGSVNLAGRTDSLTLPTVLEANEDVLVWARTVGSGFGFVSLNGTVRNPTNTVITVRFMQIMSLVTQGYTLGWKIVPAAV
ncbi:minor tail protein [Microbacterium phage Fireman]|uniref:Minor tail protein n=1 Tax=Microbacterium phage Fireman TaxID=2530118 RepID=A0A481VWP3_9CAUD|nr:minor tail protein [Microbacterium phage Fireman]QBI98123.1 minor tail protein [Microbacterium phage Fireman]